MNKEINGYKVNYSISGRIWSLVSSSMNAGSTLSPILTSILIQYTSWNISFVLVGIVDVIVGVALFSSLPDTDSNNNSKTAASTASTPWKWDMLLNKFMFAICVSYFIATFGLIAMSTWGQMLFIEKLKTDALSAGLIVSVYEIGGFCGATVSGFFADYVARNFKSKGSPRSYSGLACTAVSCLSVTSLQLLPSSNLLCKVCAFGCGFGFYGTVAMYGLLTREYVSREHAGTLTAVMGVCSQLGGFCAGSPLASFFENHHISDGFWIVAYVLPVALVCMFLLTVVEGQYKQKDD